MRYTLGSRPSAQVALRVHNQDGVLQGTSAFVNVNRSDGMRETTMSVPAFKIDKGTTKLRLKAVLIYTDAMILAESNAVTYNVRPKTSAKIIQFYPVVGCEKDAVISRWNQPCRSRASLCSAPKRSALFRPSPPSETLPAARRAAAPQPQRF